MCLEGQLIFISFSKNNKTESKKEVDPQYMIISKQNRAYEYQHKDHHPRFSVVYTLALLAL